MYREEIEIQRTMEAISEPSKHSFVTSLIDAPYPLDRIRADYVDGLIDVEHFERAVERALRAERP